MSILTGNSFDPNNDIPDLSGKTFLVTGGSAGIGFGVCAHLLQHKARILLLSNKEEHAEEAIEELKDWGDTKNIEWIQCDLADLKQTDKVARDILDQGKPLYGLVMNAGLGVGKYWLTKDDIECHFQSSDLHRAADAGSLFKDLSEINQDIGPTKLYNRSKLAQILGMLALQRRLQSGGDTIVKASAKDKIFVNASHPGAVSTDQQEQAIEAYGTLAQIAVPLIRPFMKDPVKNGCKPILYAVTSTEIEEKGISGQYIVPDKKVTDPSSKAQDVELSEQLWRLSQDLLRQKLG